MKKNRGDTTYYVIANLIAFFILFIIMDFFIRQFASNIVIKIIEFVLCAFIEERILTRLVNPIIKKILGKH